MKFLVPWFTFQIKKAGNKLPAFRRKTYIVLDYSVINEFTCIGITSLRSLYHINSGCKTTIFQLSGKAKSAFQI